MEEGGREGGREGEREGGREGDVCRVEESRRIVVNVHVALSICFH